MGLRSQATHAIGARGVAVMLATIAGAMALGWWLGGRDGRTRAVVASATSTRNVALALVIATESAADVHVNVTVAAFGALMVPPNLAFTLYQRFTARRHRRPAAPRRERAHERRRL
jgi:hypothetical protein